MRQIVVNHREHAAELVGILQNAYGFQIEIAQLKNGDCRLNSDTVVERKTCDDFCRSIVDGRLFRQAWRLSAYCEGTVMVVEGRFHERTVNVGMAAIKGAFVTLAQTYACPSCVRSIRLTPPGVWKTFICKDADMPNSPEFTRDINLNACRPKSCICWLHCPEWAQKWPA